MVCAIHRESSGPVVNGDIDGIAVKAQELDGILDAELCAAPACEVVCKRLAGVDPRHERGAVGVRVM